jgi:phosphate transport system protein
VLARSIFKRDDVLDTININAIGAFTEVIKANINTLPEALYLISIVRKLERIGDQSKNIAEEIIFYVEAKILKHTEKSTKGDQ